MEHKYLKDVSTLKLDSEKCIGCGMCIAVCPHEVFLLQNNKVSILDKDLCMECGACAKNCPASAIEVESGVGCAIAVINGLFSNSKPNCGSGSIFRRKKGNGCC